MSLLSPRDLEHPEVAVDRFLLVALSIGAIEPATGFTRTVRAGLQLLAASQAYSRLRQLRGKLTFSRTLAEIKADR